MKKEKRFCTSTLVNKDKANINKNVVLVVKDSSFLYKPARNEMDGRTEMTEGERGGENRKTYFSLNSLFSLRKQEE